MLLGTFANNMKNEQSMKERYKLSFHSVLATKSVGEQKRILESKNNTDPNIMRDVTVRTFVREVIESAESDTPLLKNEKTPATEEKTK